MHNVKCVELIKTLKLWRLLQHVSVYKETIYNFKECHPRCAGKLRGLEL